MKIKFFLILIAIAVSALLAYGLYTLCKTDGQELLLSIGGFICFFLTLGVSMAVRFEQSRISVNTAVLGVLSFLILLISHGIFAFVNFTTAAYIIINGIIRCNGQKLGYF